MPHHLPSPVKFRMDINGLRAWAVIAVLLFHFSWIGLPGGFTGVDIFFVISGYLMTSIVVGGHLKGNFSIWKFYMARVRRILPALLVLLATLLVIGWFWLPTIEYKELGKQSAFGMTFLSNVHFWQSAGYFDSAAEEKWLLHTWSLAVEAQFYVLYPLFIALIWKLWGSLKATTIGVLILFMVSMGLNIILTTKDPSAAFYLLPTRAWELAAGGLVFLIAKQGLASESIQKSGYWLGWVLVISSFFIITEHLAWPGYWAILPVLGTSLIILGQKDGCVLTDNPIAQWLGDRSYSLYLWHWPLVVALSFASLHNEWLWVIGAFVLSILLAHLSFVFVETPTRQYLTKAKLLKEIMVIASVSAVIGVGSVAVNKFSFDGVDSRFYSPEFDVAAVEEFNTNRDLRRCRYTELKEGVLGCEFGVPDSSEGVIILGDSHSEATLSSVEVAAHNQSKRIYYLGGAHGCPYVNDFEGKFPRFKCPQYKAVISSKLPKINLEHILITQNGGYFDTPLVSDEKRAFYEKNLTQGLCKLAEKRTVWVTRPIPEMPVHVPKTLSRNILFGRGNDDVKISLASYHEHNKTVWNAQDLAREQCGINILNPLDYLCDDQYCYGSKNGRPYYSDTDHLSESGNKILVPMYEQMFEAIAQK